MSRQRCVFMRASHEFEFVKRQGHRYQTPLFALTSALSDEPRARVGIIVGRRFGKAVARNRAKRRFRELARQSSQQLATHRAFLVFPKPRALDVTFADLRAVWCAALEHEGLVASGVGRS